MSTVPPPAAADAALRSVTMRYGELVIRFGSPDGATRFHLPPEYEEFRAEDGAEALCEVEWTVGPLAAPVGAPDVENEVWELRRLADGGDETTFFRTEERTPYLTLRFAPGLGRAWIRQDPLALGSDLADVGLYPMSEIMASRLLSRLEAVDLHASSVVHEGKAYLFMGHSGAGKTTISGIALDEGATVLSDDRTIVGVRDGAPIAWGTPWHGTGRHTSSRTAPIAGIFLLVQAEAERLVPLAPSRLYKEMFVRLIHQRLTMTESEAALATLDAVVASTRAWELHFRPVPEAFWAAVATASGTTAATGG